jgi:phage FluMu protein Com
MKNDPRYCSVCDKLLLKRDRSGFVLVIRCDQCNSLIHEQCYMNHHISCHNLIGVVIESEVNKEYKIFTEDLESTR